MIKAKKWRRPRQQAKTSPCVSCVSSCRWRRRRATAQAIMLSNQTQFIRATTTQVPFDEPLLGKRTVVVVAAGLMLHSIFVKLRYNYKMGHEERRPISLRTSFNFLLGTIFSCHENLVRSGEEKKKIQQQQRPPNTSDISSKIDDDATQEEDSQLFQRIWKAHKKSSLGHQWTSAKASEPIFLLHFRQN